MRNIINLSKSYPKNIRRRLFRDILFILFVTTGAVIAITARHGLNTHREISHTITTKSTRSIRSHFNNIIEPAGTIVTILAKWGAAGLLMEDSKILAARFQPLIEIQSAIHSIIIADADSFSITLSRTGKQWLITEYQNGEKITSGWIEGKKVNSKRTSAPAESGKATWFRGAMSVAPADGYFLSEPYLLDTLQETVVTASKRWTPPENRQALMVAAVTCTTSGLEEIMNTVDSSLPSNILLLKKDGTILNNIKQDSSFKIPAELPALLAKQVSLGTDADSIISFKDNRKTWWLGLGPLNEKDNNILIAVLIPEEALNNDIYKQWLRLGLLGGTVILLGIFLTVTLIRRYSHQLKDLPQQHINSETYENDIIKLIRAGESTNLEFKSTMRTNLQTGKKGKEIELAWLKTVTGFMNSDGGILLIGVSDNGDILGIGADNFANEDKCRLHFKNLLNTHIGAEFTRFIHFKSVSIAGRDILVIECERVRRPVFLTVGKNEDFYIRSGPSSIKLSMSQMIRYLGER